MAAGMIGAVRVLLGLDSAEFEEGLKKAQADLAAAGGGLKGFAKGIVSAGPMIGAAFAGAAVAIGAAVQTTINKADELSKAAQKFGVPVEQLSLLQHAANLSDVSLEQLGTGLKRLSANMADVASNGTGPAAEAFQRLGISVTNADGTLRSSTDVMMDVAARFGSMQDGAGKTALAMDLFGKSGADLIPMLNSGADGLNAMMQEARDLGLVITEDTAKSAEQFNDNLTRMGAVGAGITTQLTAGLAPALASISDAFVAAARDTQLMDGIAKVLSVTLRSLASVGVIAAAVFKQVYGRVSAVGRAALAIMQGDFKGAMEIGRQWQNDQVDIAKATAAQLKTIWSNTARQTAAQTSAQSPAVPSPSRSAASSGRGVARAGGKSDQEREVEASRERVKALMESLETDTERAAKKATQAVSDLWAAFQRGDIDAAKLHGTLLRLDGSLEVVSVAANDVGDGFRSATEISAELSDAMRDVEDYAASAGDRMANAFYESQYAIEDAFHALKDSDWVGALNAIKDAMANLKAAFQEGATSAEKFSAVAGVVAGIGNAIGGKTGRVISSTASAAMTGFTVSGGNPIGAIIGGGIGLVTSLFGGGNKAEKRRKAIEAYNAALDAQNARRELELKLMEAQGKTAAALVQRRSDELAAMDAASQALQTQIWALEDQKAAAEDAAAAIEKVTNEQQTIVDEWRGKLTASYEAEAAALQQTIDTFRELARSLRDYGRSLVNGSAGNLSPSRQYQASRAEFQRVAALAAQGDQTALSELQGVAEAYLQAARQVAPDARAYALDLAAVRDAVAAAEGYAEQQGSVADQQLSALQAAVSGLIEINNSVMSVTDAIAGLRAAQVAMAEAIRVAQESTVAANDNAPKLWTSAGYAAANPDVAAWAKTAVGKTGYDGKVITSEEAAYAYHWNNYGKFEGRAFKTGGSFEVGGFGGLDSQLMQFRATPGEMVNISRQDNMSAMASGVAGIAAGLQSLDQRLSSIERLTSEGNSNWKRVTLGGTALRTTAA